MSDKEVDAWEIFLRRFKKDDEVCLIDDMDNLYSGYLGNFDEVGCWINGGAGYRNVHVRWDETRLICHDGFPMRKLRGADGSPSIMREDSVANLIRLRLRAEGNIGIAFGDPFHIDGVRGTLYNRGNDGWENFDRDDEEILEMVSPDGAICHLWDLNTVFWCQVGRVAA